MTGGDLTALLPLIVAGAASVVVMVVAAFRRSHVLAVVLTLVGIAAALGMLPVAASAVPRRVTALLSIDSYALFYMGLILAAAFAAVLLAYGYFEKGDEEREELYVLLLVATVGSMVLVASSHFVSLFLGLEVLSVALYAMIAYRPRSGLPLEAGIKYLVLASSSAAFMLFGMALVYASVGTMDLRSLAAATAGGPAGRDALLLPGIALITTGIGFKLGVVPFHLWTPDVYEGAPAPVTGFVATVSKGAMFALLIRAFFPSVMRATTPLFVLFSAVAIASMIVGNLLALLQDNVKRLLAYSSIAHLGYLLVAFIASGRSAAAAATFYLVAYFVTTLGAFGTVTALSSPEREADALADYRGLFWRRPWLAGVFTAMLLSLAGIPLTAGFVAKFYVLGAGAGAGIWLLVIVLVVTSATGLFYYLRVVVALFQGEPTEVPPRVSQVPRLSAAGGIALVLLTVALFWLGIFPSRLLNMIAAAVRGLR